MYDIYQELEQLSIGYPKDENEVFVREYFWNAVPNLLKVLESDLKKIFGVKVEAVNCSVYVNDIERQGATVIVFGFEDNANCKYMFVELWPYQKMAILTLSKTPMDDDLVPGFNKISPLLNSNFDVELSRIRNV